jgi:predicted transposase/invertase (TIGR01784 family)
MGFLSPTNIFAFYKVFWPERNRDILLCFINAVMAFENEEFVKEISFLEPDQDPDYDYKRKSYLDVMCTRMDGKKVIVQLQIDPCMFFEERAQHYAAKAYSKQRKKEEEQGIYDDVKEVIYIALYNKIVFPKQEDYITYGVKLKEKFSEPDEKNFSITYVELPKVPCLKLEEMKTNRDRWCHFLEYAHRTTVREVQKIGAMGDELLMRAYLELDDCEWTKQERFTYEQEAMYAMDR